MSRRIMTQIEYVDKNNDSRESLIEGHSNDPEFRKMLHDMLDEFLNAPKQKSNILDKAAFLEERPRFVVFESSDFDGLYEEMMQNREKDVLIFDKEE